ncbi:MAG: AbrB/MazE/SpoVT family DNA-binding domain-containing protein [Candidatus Bathyarchaeia archaeon]
MDKRLEPIAVRAISRKGGSIYVTIPSEVARLLELELGDHLAFFKDKETGDIVIKRVAPSYTTPEGFSFSISKELAKRLLEEKGDKDER